jgi:hypothetical protein
LYGLRKRPNGNGVWLMLAFDIICRIIVTGWAGDWFHADNDR